MEDNRESINYDVMAQEIITYIRKHLTQRELSEKLGYSFNQVGKWESGAKKIKWDEFLQLSIVLELPLKNAFKQTFWSDDFEPTSPATIRMIEKGLALKKDPAFNSSGKLRKWINGQTTPSLAEILMAFDKGNHMLIAWLSHLVNCRDIPSLSSRYSLFLDFADAVFSNPICVYTFVALHLDCYQKLVEHDEMLLAEHAACSVSELRQCLLILRKLDIIRFHNKKYEITSMGFSFGGMANTKIRSLTKHTTQLAASRYPSEPIKVDPIKTPNQSMGSVRVVAMSQLASRKLADLVTKFHHETMEIVKEDSPPYDNVQIVLVHSFASNLNSPNISENN